MSRQQKPQAANFATYKVGLVQPGALSTTQLGPGWYALSSLSNVPYVTLVGRGGTQKTFTWGELVYVPDGNLVTVKNASYHAGDIYVNSGRDFCAGPRRITVPVRVKRDQQLGFFDYPVDTRGARAAWLMISRTADAEGNPQFTGGDSGFTQCQVLVRGRRLDGSLPTLNGIPKEVFSVIGGGIGYANDMLIPPNSNMIYPLGMNEIYGSPTPATMGLMDAASVAITGWNYVPPPGPTDSFSAFYVVEY